AAYVIEAIKALGDRGTATTASLLVVARSSHHEVSAAALKVLRDVSRPGDLPKLVDLALAIPPGQRDEAIDTVAEIARRGADEDQRTGPILAALSAKTASADRTDLLTILAQVGGPRALEALRKGAADPVPEVQTTSLRLLADWQTDEPMEDLLRISQAAQDSAQRAVALRGYLRMISLSETRPPDQALALYRDVAKSIHTADEKRLVLAGVQKLPALGALEFASGYLADPDVRPEAESALVQIGRGTLGAWPEETRKALEPIAQNSANDSARNGAKETLARLSKFGDFVMAWEVSPVYLKEGADYSRLFDIPFPPEEAQADRVAWRLMPVVTNPDQPWLLDLLALWGGEQRVAYLRTAVYSETARDLILELGSDDGIKVWWNGEVVLAHNTQRGVAPGQEKVTVHVKSGWNPLLLKITQNVLGWGACARFTNPDGSPATGLRYRIPSAIPSK
ncbi:MAG TPA: hypothetical protein VKU00_34795, partial [Chthonomonadaceae bacterium]|nr:hypothetical protein [Chthonomonadaceae bacterium]